jgi:SAM-dependent methyltransferase
MTLSSQKVRATLERFREIDPEERVVEVGSGAHGLIFFFGARNGVGVDPLASQYASLFPAWRNRVSTIAALGETLPFPDQSFGVVLCDNVVDHAESPSGIVAELARILTDGGLLYFTVNVHHPIYGWASHLHSAWNYLGMAYEIGPFADHTTHLSLKRARQLLHHLPLRILSESSSISEARARARKTPARHLGDRLKRIFFKNALYEVVAIREPSRGQACLWGTGRKPIPKLTRGHGGRWWPSTGPGGPKAPPDRPPEGVLVGEGSQESRSDAASENRI